MIFIGKPTAYFLSLKPRTTDVQRGNSLHCTDGRKFTPTSKLLGTAEALPHWSSFSDTFDLVGFYNPCLKQNCFFREDYLNKIGFAFFKK